MEKGALDKGKHLPPEIVFDLLIRTPAEDLVEFKKVCKLWLNLISSHEFNKAHFQHWKSKVPKIITGKENRFSSIDIQTNTQYELFCLINWNIEILDSLDGLILFHATQSFSAAKEESQLWICNPITRKRKSLIRIPGVGIEIAKIYFKLVFDPLRKKYKVFGFMFGYEALMAYMVLPTDVEGDEADREITWIPGEFEFTHNSHGEFVAVVRNGVLYWIAETITNLNEEIEVFIQSVNIVEEKLGGRIALPSQAQEAKCALLEIENMKESLCIAIPTPSSELCIWALEDWDKHGWVMKHKICLDFAGALESPSDMMSFVYDKGSIILVMDSHELKQTKLFVKSEGKLFSYCPWNQKREEISDISTRVMYVHSLVHWK